MKRDGGPAFPLGSGDIRDPNGMTLRDYFAGQALAGLMTSYATAKGSAEDCIRAAAGISYLMADEMLAERERE